jgi:hypothetical protein
MKDDISQMLLLNKKSNAEQQIFANELEKFRPHQQRISATIQYQQQAIQDLTNAFKSLMEGSEAQTLQLQHDKAERLRRNLTSDFSEANSIYNEVKEGLNRGIQFYSGVQETIESLQRNIQRFISERSNERNRLMDTIESNKSSREQELLRETLNKYTIAPPPLAPLQTQPSTSSINTTMSHLTAQTRQLSMNEPSAPFGYTPAPPPKPQAFVQQQQHHQLPPPPLHPPPPVNNPSPYGVYGSGAGRPSYQPQQQQQQAPPPPLSPYAPPPLPQSPSQNVPPRPIYNQYQPQTPTYVSQQQLPQGYYGAPPPPVGPPQPQYYSQQPPPSQQLYGHPQPMPPQGAGYHQQQGYQPQPQQWQQQHQQQPPQWQQYQQQPPPQQRPPPPSGNLLD